MSHVSTVEQTRQKIERIKRLKAFIVLEVTGFGLWAAFWAVIGNVAATTMHQHGYSVNATTLMIMFTLLGSSIGIGVLTPIIQRQLEEGSRLTFDIQKLCHANPHIAGRIRAR